MQYICIHGVPRSGTSWVGAILDSSENVAYRHQPLFSYAFKSYLSEKSSNFEIRNFFNLIKESDDEFIQQKEGKVKGHIPVFNKKDITHVIYKEARYHNILLNLLNQDKTIKVIGIVRNPKSVINSWYNASKEFKKDEWDLLQEWRNAGHKNQGRIEEFYGYNKWKEATRLFLSLKAKYPERFFLMKYKEILVRTHEITKDLFHFCGIDYSEQTARFIDQSKSLDLSGDEYSVFRLNQKDDKWKNNLPEIIIKSIDRDIVGTELEIFNE